MLTDQSSQHIARTLTDWEEPSHSVPAGFAVGTYISNYYIYYYNLVNRKYIYHLIRILFVCNEFICCRTTYMLKWRVCSPFSPLMWFLKKEDFISTRKNNLTDIIYPCNQTDNIFRWRVFIFFITWTGIQSILPINLERIFNNKLFKK